MYFKNLKFKDEIKKEFCRLCKMLHPDNGGNAADFVKMKAEFEKAFKYAKNRSKETDTNTSEQAAPGTDQEEETAREYSKLIESIIFLEGLKIEIIGTWTWVTGNTFIHKDRLKELNFHYSKSKKAWYNTGSKEWKKQRGHFTMNQIRTKFESEEVKKKNKLFLGA